MSVRAANRTSLPACSTSSSCRTSNPTSAVIGIRGAGTRSNGAADPLIRVRDRHTHLSQRTCAPGAPSMTSTTSTRRTGGSSSLASRWSRSVFASSTTSLPALPAADVTVLTSTTKRSSPKDTSRSISPSSSTMLLPITRQPCTRRNHAAMSSPSAPMRRRLAAPGSIRSWESARALRC